MADARFNARDLIKKLEHHAGPYAKFALEGRKQYINLRLKQDGQIQKMYERSIKRIAKELRDLQANGGAPVKIRHLSNIERSIAEEFAKLNGTLDDLTKQYINEGVEAGSSYSQAITLSAIEEVGIKTDPVKKAFKRVNTKAAEAMYARSRDGLYLSDRIWRNSQRARDSIRNIVQDSVVTGRDAKEVASALEKYVHTNAKTMAEQYPNMMERMKNRIPGRISYEALRLARTEMTAAFGEGTIEGGRISPSYQGVRWMLSPSHPVYDICDQFANADHGMGKGVYPKGEEPRFPPHPNCLCTLLPEHEQPEDFVGRLRDWMDDPSQQPDLEEWYQDIYKAA